MASRRLSLAPIVLLVLLALLMTVACSGSDDGGAAGSATPDEYSADLFPSTRQLDAPTLEALDGVDAAGVVRFHGVPAQLADATRGTVLLAGASNKTPAGMLRMVVDATVTDEGLELRTMSAPIQLAFRKLHARLVRRTTSLDPWQPTPLTPLDTGHGHAARSIDFSAFDGDGNPATLDDQVRVTGELGGGFDYVFGIDVDWGEVAEVPEKVFECLADIFSGGGCSVRDLLPEVKVGFEVSADATANLSVAGAAFDGFAKDFDLGHVPVDPSTIVVGGVLVFVVDVDVHGEIDGDASSRFAAKAGFDLETGAGVSFSSRSGASAEPPHLTKTITPPVAEASLTARARASVGPRLSLRLYDAVGAYAQLSAFTELRAERARSPCFDLHGGGILTLGFDIGLGLPGFGYVDLGSWGKDFPLFDESLATGSCTVPPGASSLPPGAGPDADHLMNPTFAPWSKSLDEGLASFAYLPWELAATRVVRTIDGHYVLAGLQAAALTKVTDAGDVLWSRRFVADDFGDDYDDPVVLRPGRVAATKDAALFVSTYPMGLLEVGQSGGLAWARKLELERAHQVWQGMNGNADELDTLDDLVADGSGGAFAVGTYVAPGETASRMLLLRFAPDGRVLLARSFALPNQWVYPTALVRLGADLVVAGVTWTPHHATPMPGEGELAFVARLTPGGGIVWAKRFVCGDATPEMQPNVAVVSAGGNLAVAGWIAPAAPDGFAAPYYRGFVMGLGSDGARQWFTEPWSGESGSYFDITSLEELPTTGFVAAGNYTKATEPTELAFGGLDATGHLQWLRGYQLTNDDPANEGTSAFGSVRLADDGGAVIGAYSSVPTSGVIYSGSLWLLKVPAKDGAITFAPGVASTRALPFANTTCANMTEAPLAFAVGEAAATTTLVHVDDEPLGATPRSHVP